MTPTDLHGMFVDNRALIADTWNFFVTVHMALIGLMFLARGAHVPFLARLLVLPGYAAFMYINYRAQVDNYTYTAEIIRKLQAEGDGGLPTTMFRVGWVTEYLPWIYLGAAAFSVLVILGTSLLPGRPKD
jgi:hypothetical protein